MAQVQRALVAREALRSAEGAYWREYLKAVRDLRAMGWSWPRMGRVLVLTPTAVRRFWDRNQFAAGRLP